MSDEESRSSVGCLVRTEAGGVRPMTLDEVCNMQIRFVLKRCRGNKTVAAEILGIDRRTLYRSLERMNGAPMKHTNDVI